MMKLPLLSSLIFLALIAHSSCQVKGSIKGEAKHFLPCPFCVHGGPEVCARPTNGGPDETFENNCYLQLQDCGQTESPFTILHEGKCKENKESRSPKIIFSQSE